MNQDTLKEYCEFIELSQTLLCENPSDDYISFLRFCEDRLRKDKQVQAIWSDYLSQEK